MASRKSKKTAATSVVLARYAIGGEAAGVRETDGKGNRFCGTDEEAEEAARKEAWEALAAQEGGTDGKGNLIA